MIHDLKTWPDDFAAIANGTKTHEARKADRDFAVGDTLRMREYDPQRADYTGRVLDVTVTHLTRGQYGLPPDLVVMSMLREQCR